MAQRSEPHDSLDDFPTPPWSTRAFLEYVVAPVVGGLDEMAKLSAWEPACNRGYMARPLAEYFRRVYASDVFDYSVHGAPWCQDRVVDFLWPDSENTAISKHGVDWIITNPPFRLAQQFIWRARQVKGVRGVAMLTRTSFLEGVGRYEQLFSVTPPNVIAQFSERVPMVKGRLDPSISTATSYCWMVWITGASDTKFVWIPPCKKKLDRADDWPQKLET